MRFTAMAAGALSYALRIPRATASAATDTPTTEEAPMLNALQEFQSRLETVAARLDAQYDAAQQFAASVDAERQYVRGVTADLERFIMANATELVNEAFTRLQTDETKVDEQQKTIDQQTQEITDLQKQVTDAKANAVDQATLDKLDAFLHPPTPPVEPPVAPPAP